MTEAAMVVHQETIDWLLHEIPDVAPVVQNWIENDEITVIEHGN
jgi:hypothetical protein